MSKNLRSFIIIFSLAFMLLGGLFTPSTTFARGQEAESISVRMMQKAASILFGEIPDDTVKTAFEFAEVVQNDPHQRQETFTQLGEFFIEIGKNRNVQEAVANFVQKQPVLSDWHEVYDDGDNRGCIIAIILIIIFLLIPLAAS